MPRSLAALDLLVVLLPLARRPVAGHPLREVVEKDNRWFHIGGPVDIWLRTGFVYAVPVGITVGALVAATIELKGGHRGAAWGVWAGVVVALVVGVVVGAIRGPHYEFDRWEGTPPLDKLEEALNIAAADNRYVMMRKEGRYIVYGPTMALPVAAGPLTISGAYRLVIVQFSDKSVTIIGPRDTVLKLADAAKASGVVPLDGSGAAGQSEQAAHADS